MLFIEIAEDERDLLALTISLLTSESELEDTLINQQFEDSILDICSNHEQLFTKVYLSRGCLQLI